jgi:hypothetical protein
MILSALLVIFMYQNLERHERPAEVEPDACQPQQLTTDQKFKPMGKFATTIQIKLLRDQPGFELSMFPISDQCLLPVLITHRRTASFSPLPPHWCFLSAIDFPEHLDSERTPWFPSNSGLENTFCLPRLRLLVCSEDPCMGDGLAMCL